MNLNRIWTIASHGLRQSLRDRLYYLISFFALLLLLAVRILPQISLNTYPQIFADLGLAAIAILSALAAIVVGTTVISQEIENRTVLILIPKPISRAEFILGKQLSLLVFSAGLVALMMVIYFVLLSLENIQFSWVSLIVSSVYLVVELAIISSLTLALGVFTNPTMAMLLGFGAYVLGHFSRELLALGQLTENPRVQRLMEALYLCLPDLERFNLRNDAVYGLLPNTDVLLGSFLYGCCYSAALLAIATLLFARRQF